jgi:hypothetical protein
VICSKRPIHKYNFDRNTALVQLAAFLVFLGAGGCGSGSTTTTVNQVVVTISPASASVATSNPQQFTATVTGTKNTKVTWSATAGTISGSGLYTAPATVPNPPLVAVTATSVADTADAAAAQVTIVPGANAISVSLSPVSGTVANFGTLQFVASVSGDANTAVTWYVNGIQGGSQSTGYISNSGLYVAPGGVPTQTNGSGSTKASTARVTAVLNDNTAYSATANVTILPANQSIQTAPIEFGASGGNPNDASNDNKVAVCCGGTLGALIALDNTQYILSTNHTLARSDAANVGDPIVQPGLLDANCDSTRTTTVANLSSFFPVQNSQPPNIDAAIAQVVPGKVDAGGKLLYLGDTTDANRIPVAGAPHAGAGLSAGVSLIGREVAKSGRTTGLTCSTIDSIEMAVTVEYVQNCDGTGIPINVQFTGQVDVAGSAFSAQGDSGSLVVSQDTADPVGLLFAASDSSSVANPISDVLNYFQDANGNLPTVVGGAAHAVIGCTLPTAPASAQSVAPAAALTNSVVANAIRTRDTHLSEILASAEVGAVGVGASRDNASEAAILLFVTENKPYTNLPRQIEGIRTRIIQAATLPRYGALSPAESTKVEESVEPFRFASTLSESEFKRAQTVHSANVASLLKQRGVQGVGISLSLDSPGEAALMVFLVRGAAHDSIPAVIDGVRTRVKESNRFRANYGGAQPDHRCTVPLKKISPTGSPREQ